LSRQIPTSAAAKEAFDLESVTRQRAFSKAKLLHDDLI
jgi:hypothetical protein